MYEKLHIIITLIAAIAVALFSFIFFESLTKAAVGLIITIVVFYIIGSVFKKIIDKGLEEAKIKEEESEISDAEFEDEQEQDEISL